MALHALILAVLLTLTGCKRPAVEAPSRAAPATPVAVSVKSPESSPTPASPLIKTPPAPFLAPAGRVLIYEFEVGGKSGYDPRPEAPDARASGVTWGIGYDAHQNSPSAILQDWQRLGARPAQRLADTHPFVGRSAQDHLPQVRDILVSWQHASDVFDQIDVGREFSAAKRNWPGFLDLRPNAQAALISNGFNRGWAVVGAQRAEMREMKRLVPFKDYAGIAAQLRKSERVWRGTSIYNGLRRRRFAEAKLCETP